MNIINKCLSELSYRIPPQLLQQAFKEDVVNWRQAPISLNEKISNKVIRPRVLVDTNLVGGQVVVIPLAGITPRYVDNYMIVYEVPEELCNYRTIMSVLSIGYLPYSGSFNGMSQGMGIVNTNSMSDLMSAAQRVGDSHANIPSISNASVELIGQNTVMIRDQLRMTNAYQLRCVIGNEENLNNIQPRSIPTIARLVELAVKSYIYNTMIIKVDQAYLTGGQELGAMKNIIEGYSDAEQMYQDYLKEVVASVMFMNNSVTAYERLIKLQVSPSL